MKISPQALAPVHLQQQLRPPGMVTPQQTGPSVVLPPDDGYTPGKPVPPETATVVAPAPRVEAGPEHKAQVDAVLRDWFGGKVTRDSLEKQLASCLPSAALVLMDGVGKTADGKPHIGYSADYRDKDGEQIAQCNVGISEKPDGSLHMIWFNVWLDPEHRTEPFFPKLVDANINQLLKLNSHSETTLEIGAGGSKGISDDKQERVGGYLWARLGLFAFDERSQARMSEAFGKWLQLQAAEYPALTPTIVDQVIASSKSWTPEQFAEFDLPSVKVPITRVDGRPRTASLGKAFLMSDGTPGWGGRCKINQGMDEALERASRTMSFGGRESSATAPISKSELEHKLLGQVEDSSRTADERRHHAAALAEVRGWVDPQELQAQFSYLHGVASLWEEHAAQPLSDRVASTLGQAAWDDNQAALKETEARLGQPVPIPTQRRLQTESRGYPSRYRELLAELQPGAVPQA